MGRLPDFLKRGIIDTEKTKKVRGLLRQHGLYTICESGRCPNKAECYAHNTASFLIMGNICTRNCRYCNVQTGKPLELDNDEPKKRTGLKNLMSIAVVICFIAAAATAIISGVFGVDTGKAFSGNLRAFSVPETEAIGLNKGDLVITENVYAQADDLYVFVNQATHTYDFGKVTASTTNLSGDYLYITQTADGVQLINRDLSMGVIVAKYSSVGSVLSVICDYSILIIVSLVIFIAALIVCLVIITRKRRLYEEASAIYDHMESSDDDDNGSDDNESDESNNNDEYYSDYDTDGIEQGLFSGI